MPIVASAPDAAAPSRPFTPEEDSALLSAVRVRGTKWTEIVGSLVDSGEQYAALARFDAAQLCHRFAHLRHAQGTTAPEADYTEAHTVQPYSVRGPFYAEASTATCLMLCFVTFVPEASFQPPVLSCGCTHKFNTLSKITYPCATQRGRIGWMYLL